MTTQLTINEIERRLRFAAPDEPAILPALALPSRVGRVRSPAVRFRGSDVGTQDARFVYAVIAILLALALAITAGAVRLLTEDEKPLTTVCDPMIAGLEDCFPVNVPAGWVDHGAGQFQAGEFSEPGIGYAFVQQVMASAPLGACPTPGGPFPGAVPSGDGSYVDVPLPTPDAGLACIRAAPLPENAIRIVTFSASRIVGTGDEATGAIIDSSEPSPEAGWTETVDGRPARLQVITGSAGEPAETRIWDVIRPGSISSVLRIRADIAGPDLESGRAAVQRVVDAVDFKWDVPPLEDDQADDVLRSLLDQLDRSARDSTHSDLYGCFPREPGAADAAINGSDSGPLAAPLPVTCTSRIEPSVAGVWRITLDVKWEAGDGYAADTLRSQYFSTGQAYGMGGIDVSGGETASLSGRTANWEDGSFSWFPNSHYQLPPSLNGPLDLPAGSLAKILWPGEDTTSEPGTRDDSLYPGIVGTHVWVLDGPEVIDGDEWYRVQAGTSFAVVAGWMRGTRDGRPQLERIEPDCPPERGITVGELTWLIAAERLLCFEDRDLAIDQGVLEFEEGFAGAECMGDDNVVRPCPTPAGESGWIAGLQSWTLFGAGGREGPEPGLSVWLAPGVAVPPDGQAVRVEGHFDDPAAAACGQLGPEGFPFGESEHEVRVLVCRERFVITSIEPR